MSVLRALKMPFQLLAQHVRGFIRFEDGKIISTRNGMDGEPGLLDRPTLLTRGALGKNHLLLSLVDIEASYARMLSLVRLSIML